MPPRKSPIIANELIDQLLAGTDAASALHDGRLLDSLKKALAERVLNAELDHHLSQETQGNNSRNGYGKKTVTTGSGRVDLAIAPAALIRC